MTRLGQTTKIDVPNGMDTYYSFDNRNDLTKPEHKDVATVEDGFTYAYVFRFSTFGTVGWLRLGESW